MMPIIFGILFLAAILYVMARAIFSIYAEYDLLEKTLAILFLVSEAFLMLHAIAYYRTVYLRIGAKSHAAPQAKPLHSQPSVAVLVAARHEPKEVLRGTFLAIKNMNYPNLSVYFLDDSSEANYQREAEQITTELRIHLFRRNKPRHGAKAGIVNDCLESIDADYVAIFDADQNPMAKFMDEVIPILESNPKLAFVQTPQFYSNPSFNRITEANSTQQGVFYEFICEGKSELSSMICCGTNVVFRKSALDDVNGLDESTVTEDFATTIHMHMKGWQSVYLSKVSTFGMGPTDLGNYFKQQYRWAIGNIGVLRFVIRELFTRKNRMLFKQWVEHLITGSYYLVSWAYMLLILCPIIYILTSVPSFFMREEIYLLTFVPYFIMSMGIFYQGMKSRGYSISNLFKAQLLTFITMPIYLKASILGIFGIKGSFVITSKEGSTRLPYRDLWPQLLLWTIHLIAIAWGANRIYHEKSLPILVSMIWVLYHFVLLSSIFYFNENQFEDSRWIKRIKKRSKVSFQKVGNQSPGKPESYSKESCYQTLISDKLDCHGEYLFHLSRSGQQEVLFKAIILWQAKKMARTGFRTVMSISSIADSDNEKLRGYVN